LLQAALDHVGDQVRQGAPVLFGDSEEVFEDALGEGDDGALAELAVLSQQVVQLTRRCEASTG
jgi:hypothetical protein